MIAAFTSDMYNEPNNTPIDNTNPTILTALMEFCNNVVSNISGTDKNSALATDANIDSIYPS